MNYKIVLNVLGKVLIIAAAFMCCPLIIALIYGEFNALIGFLLPVGGLLLLGLPLILAIKPKENHIYAKEGFVIVGLTWIILSLVGALPFVINGEIPNYINAFFETASGFTTTGASILSGSEIENLSKSASFWRIFTHFIGGMGVLVFLLAVLPQNNGAMHLYRTEAPGPSAQKLVSKMRFTARILYLIYVGLTAILFIMLLFGGLDVFEALLHSFSTAGTGGFSTRGDSIASFNSAYIEIVIATFMLLFGVNFNVFYLILIGGIVKAVKSEELHAYLIMLLVAVFVIALNITSICANFGEALRYAFFQTTAISSTTGFVTANFDAWPALSKAIIFFLMIIGACGGSTGGGLKVSRMIILGKSTYGDLKKMLHPRAVVTNRFEKENVSSETINAVRVHLILWLLLVILGTLILSIDCNDLFTNLSASITCIGNVGPGFNLVGPICNFGFYSWYSKVLLSLIMIAGRLEIIPIIMLFSPKTWKK